MRKVHQNTDTFEAGLDRKDNPGHNFRIIWHQLFIAGRLSHVDLRSDFEAALTLDQKVTQRCIESFLCPRSEPKYDLKLTFPHSLYSLKLSESGASVDPIAGSPSDPLKRAK